MVVSRTCHDFCENTCRAAPQDLCCSVINFCAASNPEFSLLRNSSYLRHTEKSPRLLTTLWKWGWWFQPSPPKTGLGFAIVMKTLLQKHTCASKSKGKNCCWEFSPSLEQDVAWRMLVLSHGSWSAGLTLAPFWCCPQWVFTRRPHTFFPSYKLVSFWLLWPYGEFQTSELLLVRGHQPLFQSWLWGFPGLQQERGGWAECELVHIWVVSSPQDTVQNPWASLTSK